MTVEPGVITLTWCPDKDSVSRLAYLVPTPGEGPDTFTFYELWNEEAWNRINPRLDLMPALQREIDEGRLSASRIITGPDGKMDHEPISLEGVDLYRASPPDDTVSVGSRTMPRWLRFEHLKIADGS
jgi:hypothetical protein